MLIFKRDYNTYLSESRIAWILCTGGRGILPVGGTHCGALNHHRGIRGDFLKWGQDQAGGAHWAGAGCRRASAAQFHLYVQPAWI